MSNIQHPDWSSASQLFLPRHLQVIYHFFIPNNQFLFLDSRFADDGANFSINTDDPMVTGTWTEQEYELLRSWGLKESHLVKSNINALKASFLPDAFAMLSKCQRWLMLVPPIVVRESQMWNLTRTNCPASLKSIKSVFGERHSYFFMQKKLIEKLLT